MAVSRFERAIVWIWAGVLATLSAVPIFDGYRHAPAGSEFCGFVGIFQNDYYGYLAWLRQAFDGFATFRVLYTTEPHGRWLFHPLFWAMGTLARITGLSLIQVWHLAQLAGCVALVPALYGFFARCSESRAVRLIALGLATTGSGVGWLWRRMATVPATLPFEQRPIDLWMVEAQPFPALMTSFFTLTLALALLLVALGRALDVAEHGRWKDAVWGGLAALALVAIHPYDAVPLFAILGAWIFGARFAHRRALTLFFLLPLPYVIYGAAVTRFAAVFSEVRWFMPLPSFPAHVLGLGVPLMLAGIAVCAPRVRAQNPRWLLPALWVLITAALLLVPAPFARKWIWGAFVPLSLLAAMGLATWSRALRTRGSRAAAALVVIAFVSVGSAEYYARLLLRNRNPHLGDFLPQPYVDALRWLDEHAGPAEVVLATPTIAPWLPGRTGVTVFAGHWAQTIDIERKQRFVLQLFSGTNSPPPEAIRRVLERNRVRYVVADTAAGAAYAFGEFVHPVFANSAVNIWEINGYRPSPGNAPWARGTTWAD